MKKPLSILLLLSLFTFANITLAKGTDIITMNNGNIHNGIIDNKKFEFITGFGEVTIPYEHMGDLHLSNKPGQDKLTTKSGDTFYGDIQTQQLTILRTLDPVLPVEMKNISQIYFSKKSIRKKDSFYKIIKTRFGDQFSAQVIPETINVHSADKSITIAINNIKAIDIDKLIDDEKIRIQARTKSKKIIMGSWDKQSISIKTTFHQILKLKPAILSSITVNPQNTDHTNFKYIRDKLTDKSLGPEVVELKSASYIRGDNNGDSDEKPAMPVNIKKFAIGTHEITFSQYDKFCDDTKRDKPDDQEWGRKTRPVVNISWEDATAYTQWLSKKSGKKYRLPTDAEWEYAARAGTNTPYWWGNNPGTAMANCEGCSSIWSGEKTAPVKRFPANAFGLYDTAGNVFEWVADCYHNTFEYAPKDGSALDKPGCGKRVIRGGSWSFPEKESRSANRWRDFPTRRSDDTGFRVVRELD